MSETNGTQLDLEVIAGLLRPEDLDPPQGDQAHPIKVDEAVDITQKTDSINVQDGSEEKATAEHERMIKEEDSTIPGLDVPAAAGNEDATMRIEEATLGRPAESALDSILAKHGLQTVVSDSSDETEEASDEEESSSSETESDSSDSSDTDSGSSSSEAPSKRDSNAPESSSRQHKRNKEKLVKMTQDDVDSEDGMDLPSGSQPLSMFATAHEIIAPQVTMPSITEIPEDEPIEIIGEVMSVVDSVVVVKSLNNGMQRVLDTDSLLVWENRKALGLVFETFGPLTAPLYSIRFPSATHFPAALSAFLESPNGPLKVYYCPSRSTFAYTSKLMLNKGNDASNFFDEEVAEEELEFSDDEAEREWKRLHDRSGKRKRRAGSKAGSSYSESPRLGGRSSLPYGEEDDDSMSIGGDVGLSYVDPYDDEPGNSLELSPSTSNGPSIHSSTSSNFGSLPSRPNDNRSAQNRARGRGRGGRAGFSGNRGRGRGRGQPMRERGRQPPLHGQYPPLSMPPPATNGYNPHTEYDPSFSANISPTAVHQSVNMGQMYGGTSAGGYHNASHMGAFMGMQHPQMHGMSNGSMYGMHAGGAPMHHPMGAGQGLTPAGGGPTPGAFINPRFAMMQLMSPGGIPGPNPGSYQYGDEFQNGRQNPPR